MDGSTVIAHLADGTLRGWGSGYFGVLGDGEYSTFSARPRSPKGLGPVLAHYMSGSSSYAIRRDGSVLAWGIPSTGGSVDFVLVPTPVFTVPLAP
jgi:alpha-tubulin suppressor-like RCC1 family protein